MRRRLEWMVHKVNNAEDGYITQVLINGVLGMWPKSQFPRRGLFRTWPIAVG
jgi:hypothetical protein